VPILWIKYAGSLAQRWSKYLIHVSVEIPDFGFKLDKSAYFTVCPFLTTEVLGIFFAIAIVPADTKFYVF